MSTILDARTALLSLHDLTSGLKRGAPPDIASVLGYHGELVRLYALLGEEFSQKFGTKERAYLARKIAQAKEHANGRVQLKLTSKDAEEAAFLAVGEEYGKEIEAMESFELYKVMMKSVQNAIDYARSVTSYLKVSESQA